MWYQNAENDIRYTKQTRSLNRNNFLIHNIFCFKRLKQVHKLCTYVYLNQINVYMHIEHIIFVYCENDNSFHIYFPVICNRAECFYCIKEYIWHNKSIIKLLSQFQTCILNKNIIRYKYHRLHERELTNNHF